MMTRDGIFERIKRIVDFRRQQDENLDLLDRMLLFNRDIGSVNAVACGIHLAYKQHRCMPYDMYNEFSDKMIKVLANKFLVIQCTQPSGWEGLEWDCFIEAVNMELKRLEYLYSDTNLSFIEWISKLNEEVGIANKTANSIHFYEAIPERLADDLIRVAAVAIRIIEYLENSLEDEREETKC